MKSIKYGVLLHGSVAKILHLGDGYYEVTDSKSAPDWLMDDPKIIGEFLFEDVSLYNSSEDRPSWGGHDRDQFCPVKVEVETTVTKIDVEIPVNVKTIDCRGIHRRVVKLYGPDVPTTEKDDYVWCLVEGKLEDHLPNVGKAVCFGSIHLKREVIAAVETPEEYVPVGDGRVKELERSRHKPVPNGHCLLICKSLRS